MKSDTGREADHVQALDALEQLVREAKSVPLSASAVVPREEVLALVQRLRETLPKEHEEAKEVLSERDRVLEEAHEQARRIVEDARAERARLVAETEVVKEADRESKRLVGEANTAADELRRRADDYVDAKLAKFEILLNKVQRQVNKGRDQLRRRLEAAEDEVPPLTLEDSGEISGPLGEGGKPEGS